MPQNKYDLIFSIGEACSCTQALRKCGLQLFSYPFDWLFGSDFFGRCKILASDFDRFLEFDDLEFRFSDRSSSCDAYYNRYNDLTFNHDFSAGKNLVETFSAVKEKYTRRISRLLNNINNAQHILLVYIGLPNTNEILSFDIVQEGLELIRKHFSGRDIDLLCIQNISSSKELKQYENGITMLSMSYKCGDLSQPDYAVNQKKLISVLHFYKLKKTLTFRIKVYFQKIFVNLIPNKEARNNLKKKYHL